MPARRTAREERPRARRASTQEPERYEEADAEDYEEDAQDRDAYSLEEEEEEEAEEPDGRESRGRRARGRGPKRIPAAQAAQAGLRGLVDLIGKQPEGVTSVEPTEDGWLIGVEVIEDQRVPSSADVLAVYEAELDADGDLLSYRRAARYTRGRGDQARDS